MAIEFFDLDPEVQQRKFAFKCHRKRVSFGFCPSLLCGACPALTADCFRACVQIGGIDSVYPVNAIAYHPVHGTFATGGCDNKVGGFLLPCAQHDTGEKESDPGSDISLDGYSREGRSRQSHDDWADGAGMAGMQRDTVGRIEQRGQIETES